MLTPEQIRSARGMMGWTQAELASRCRLSTTSLNNIERGLTTPKDITVNAIRRAFEEEGLAFIPASGTLGPGVRLCFASRPAVIGGHPVIRPEGLSSDRVCRLLGEAVQEPGCQSLRLFLLPNSVPGAHYKYTLNALLEFDDRCLLTDRSTWYLALDSLRRMAEVLAVYDAALKGRQLTEFVRAPLPQDTEPLEAAEALDLIRKQSADKLVDFEQLEALGRAYPALVTTDAECF
ncbi:helix-turn-helix protein [Nitrospirillum pindoramense]|uniref:Helix-turn-helix protein n=2 Tax=Nitrospirillum amazonense TaxID=28077 RepID=A0A560HH66_9PROT|nr:helix-turn-helix protein [Nitrospirillum amazonense]